MTLLHMQTCMHLCVRTEAVLIAYDLIVQYLICDFRLASADTHCADERSSCDESDEDFETEEERGWCCDILEKANSVCSYVMH